MIKGRSSQENSVNIKLITHIESIDKHKSFVHLTEHNYVMIDYSLGDYYTYDNIIRNLSLKSIYDCHNVIVTLVSSRRMR